MTPKQRPHKPLPLEEEISSGFLTKEQFGRKLYEIMSSRGWNQSELARRAGMNRDNVSQYIRGRTYPTPKFLSKLAKALDLTPDELLPNYYEDAVQRTTPPLEYREIPGDDKHCWIRINKRVLKKNATKIIDLANE